MWFKNIVCTICIDAHIQEGSGASKKVDPMLIYISFLDSQS